MGLLRRALCVALGLFVWSAPVCRADEPPATPPREAVKTFKITDGLDVRLVASEPLIRQPLSLSFDDRGRLWVLQYIQYPNPEGLRPVAVDEFLRTKYDRRPEPPPKGPRGHDVIAILEDTDGDGVMDRAKTFLTGLNLASGMALGYGGVFVAQPPYLLFYRDANGDDVPDGDPEVLLTGFGMEDAHAFANSLTWGPDGWLYGAQGSTVSAKIRGIEFQQGIWRYHPRTKQFELFAEGGGNTWGIDFDRFGNLFAGGNTYEPLCHHVQGAYYVKGFGKHGPLHNPYSFGYFDPVKHYGPFGGGLTGGCSIYQGGAFPERFNNACIAPNMRQNALRWYTFEKRGSTFATRQGGDFILSSDPWFRPVDTLVGPDGALYLADWYDINLSHTNPKNRSQWYAPSRDDGRIFRVSAPGAKSFDKPRTRLGALASRDVTALLNHPNEWYRREAWRILGERRDASVVPALKQKFAAASDETAALEALWAIDLCGGFDEAFAERTLGHPAEYVRAWTVRLLGDDRHVSKKIAAALVRLAKSDPSVVVRSQLACTAKRLPAASALPIAAELFQRDEDADDPQLPLLIWWAIESKAVTDREAVLALVERPETWQRPIVRDVLVERLARRYVALGDDGGYAACAWLWEHAPTAPDVERIVAGMETQLAGHRFNHPPQALDQPLARLLNHGRLNHGRPSTALLCLAIRLGSPDAVPKLAERVQDSATKPAERITAIRALSEAGPPQVAHQLLSLLDRRRREPEAVEEAVLTAVGRFKEESLGTRLLARWPSLSARLRDRSVDVLASRTVWSRQLLKAVAAGQVDPKSISTEQIRQLLLHGDAQIARQVTARWGSIRTTTPREKEGKIKAVSSMLTKGKGDLPSGHKLFVKHCSICHRLYGEGNQIGPDLTAADRKNLTVLLPNVIDPSAVIRPEFRSYNVVLDDGRILSGLLADSNNSTVTVLDAKNQRTVVKRTNVEELKVSDTSLMPDNVLEPLGDQEIRDLFAYLRAK
ncbi:MAG TPA: PVC-type heme-binding CxxCH protein [Planctomycetaceae bacterium]|nr:PVC-type heme-binding CxxCH protein [Planctomycetaceae bacterium]